MAGKVVSLEFEIISKLDSYFLMTVICEYHAAVHCTGWGLCIGTANRIYQITDFWLGLSKKVKNIISKSVKNVRF